MKHLGFGSAFLPFLLSFQSVFAAPDEVFDQPKLVAIENRSFNPKYDLTANLSLLPLDAFYKGMAGGLSYTHTFTSAWSWEVANVNMVSKTDTNLKNDLINNFNVQPQGILDHIQFYLSTNAIYTPIYSKNLLYNSELLYGSFSFLFGGGAVRFSSNETSGMAGVGFILRAFHSARFSSKLDTRVYYHFAPNKSSDMILLLTYGLSFELGSNKPLESQ